MKIVTLIPSFFPREGTIERVIEEAKKFSSKIVVFTADAARSFPDCDVHYYDRSIGVNLVFEPRKWIERHIDSDWDYVIYNEDDILLPKSSVDEAIHLQESIADSHVIGFNRFERHNGEKYWIDQHPDHGVHTGKSGRQILAKDELFWIPANYHSGNFMLPKAMVKKLIDEKKFDTYHNQYGVTYCGVLESAATSLYRHVTKTLPINFEMVECEHLDNKYCFIEPTPRTQQLKDILNA